MTDDDAEAGRHDLVVRQYGARPPRDWGADCDEVLVRMGRLWNRLVEIDQAAQAARAAAEADMPELAEWGRAHDLALAGLEAARAKVARHKAQHRTATVPADLAEARRWMGQAVKVARAMMRHARAAAKPRLAAAYAAAEDARRAAVKAARQPASSGLWWCQYNEVIARYEAARSAMLRARAAGKPAALRFRRALPEGTLAVQIQGGMTLAQLTGAAPGGRFGPALSLRPLPPAIRARDAAPLWLLTMPIAAEQRGQYRTISLPVHLHRPIPDDARIQMVRASRRLLPGGREEWRVTFTCRREKPAAKVAPGRAVAGVELGWRALADGALRVAVIAVQHPGRARPDIEEVTVPAQALRRLDLAEELQAERDAAANALRARLLARADWPEDEALAEALRRLRHPQAKAVPALRRLAGVVEGRPVLAADDPARRDLADWLHGGPGEDGGDLRDHYRQLAMTRRAVARRLDAYRQVAARLARLCHTVAIRDGLDLRQIARESELPAPIPRHAARASPGLLRQAIQHAAARDGVAVIARGGTLTGVCPACGTATARDAAARAALIHRCAGCGHVHDQDHAAAILLCRAASAPAAPEGPSPLAA